MENSAIVASSSPNAMYLITTADERAWKFDQTVIFLGEWCRLNSRKHVWQHMDSIVAKPYGLGQAQKDADHAEARALEGEIFPLLCEVLNEHHGTRHSERFWSIVLGHWLRRFVDVILNRVKTLEHCLLVHQISGTCALVEESYCLAPPDSATAISYYDNEVWNNMVYIKILNLLNVRNVIIDVMPVDVNSASSNTNVCTRVVRNSKDYLSVSYWFSFIKKISEFLTCDNDVLIIGSYLPKLFELKLQLSLQQAPIFRSSPKLLLVSRIDLNIRTELATKFANDSSSNLLNITKKLLFECLPICYLEGYGEISNVIERLNWPKRPRSIFSSNNFDTCEIFKRWTAMKVDLGCKYVVGQHGNNYGTHRYFGMNTIEEETADLFISWGVKTLANHRPAFVLKKAGRTGVNPTNNSGGVLLTEFPSYPRITTWDVSHEHEEYFFSQKKFFESLDSRIQRKLTVRLHKSNISSPGGIRKEQWRSCSQYIAFDYGFKKIEKVISKSRLVIHSYDSTGILENLSDNIPMIAYWQNEYEHITDDARPYYELLVSVGIFHLSPSSAALKVNEIWDDVAYWWAQSAVQNARQVFCRKFALTTDDPISTLKNILK
jgi:putative transferase (TIGR04331 family)